MSGYCGYSMSNNAISAYQSGEKPLSKWCKYEIIAEIEAQNLSADVMNALRKLPFDVLKQNVLVKSSWHHTSLMYNQTSFYIVDDLSCYTVDDIKKWTVQSKAAKEKCEKKVRAEWIEWEGNYRRYKKPVRHESTGTIIGAWFFPDDGGKKKLVDGSSFKILEVLE